MRPGRSSKSRLGRSPQRKVPTKCLALSLQLGFGDNCLLDKWSNSFQKAQVGGYKVRM